MANEPYQPISVNTGSAQSAIQATPNAVPALDGLMENIKSGFISADDIRRRISDGPLEAATRKENLTNVQQIQPLQREAATAQLQNVTAKEKMVAESLPILQATGRVTLAQDFENAKQNGAPDAILKSFYASVPGLIPWDPAKLTDPKTGQLNLAYAIETTQKAHEKAAKIASSKPIIVKKVNVDETGRETTTETATNPLTGEAVGVSIPTGVKEVNVAERDAKAAAGKAGLSNDVLAERQRSDIIKAYVPQSRAFEAIDGIRNRGTPPKNADDLAILYEFIKVLDPTSVVREGEKKFAESTAPGAQAFWNKVQGLWSDSNKTMDSDTRNNLYNTIDTLRGSSEKSVLPELKRLSNLAIDRGMPLAQALTEPELKLLVNGTTVPGQPPAKNLADMGIEELKNVSIEGRTPAGAASIPTVQTPAEANALPANIEFFKTPTGATKRNKNFRASGTTAAPAVSPAAGNLADMTIEQLKEIPIEGLGGRSLADLSIEELKNITIAP